MRLLNIVLLIIVLALVIGAKERDIDKLLDHLATEIARTVEEDKKVICWDIRNLNTDTPSWLGRYLVMELSNCLARKMPNNIINPFEAERKIADELTYHITYPTPESVYASFHNDYSLSGYYIIDEDERIIKIELTVSEALKPHIKYSFYDEIIVDEVGFAELLEWHRRSPRVKLSDDASKFLTENGTSNALMKKVGLVDREGRPVIDTFSVGGWCWIEVVLYEPAHIYVIGFDRQAQRFYLLYPGGKEMNNFFSGKVYIPSTRTEERTIGIKMVPPAGFNWFKVITTRQKVEWESIQLSPDEHGVMWLNDEELLTFINNLNDQSGGWQAVLTEVWIEE